MITKKDLIALAEWASDEDLNPLQLQSLARFLKRNNPRFMEQRWIGYVNGDNGPNGGRIEIDSPEWV